MYNSPAAILSGFIRGDVSLCGDNLAGRYYVDYCCSFPRRQTKLDGPAGVFPQRIPWGMYIIIVFYTTTWRALCKPSAWGVLEINATSCRANGTALMPIHVPNACTSQLEMWFFTDTMLWHYRILTSKTCVSRTILSPGMNMISGKLTTTIFYSFKHA